MKVILQRSVQKLGNAGDVVEASDGFFRNFLQPRKLAVPATDGALKKREEDLESLRKKAEKAHQELVDLASKITDLGNLRIVAKCGDGGKLYGKVTNKEITQELKAALGVDVDKRLIKLPEEINILGSYKVQIKFASDVQSTIMLEIVSQEKDAS